MRSRFILGGLIAACTLALGTVSVADSHDDNNRFSIISSAKADSRLSVSVSSVTMTVGQTTTVGVSGSSGTVRLSNSDASVASATYSNRTVTIKGLKTGSTDIKVSDNNSSKTIKVSVIGGLTVSLSNVALTVGNSSTVLVSGASGSVSLTNSAPAVASATYAKGVITIKGLTAGSDTIGVRDSRTTKNISVTVVNGGGGGTTPPTAGTYSLLAWNDLGMHCVDGKDFSIFSILPPYNNLHAQLVNKATNKLVTTGVTLTYESLADTTVPTTDPLYKSINTISSTKTNFWTYVQALFGAKPPNDFGLNLNSTTISNRTPGTTPMQMQLAPSGDMFIAEGLPITPFDDAGKKNFYPMVKVTAKDSAGNVLATARTVLPVSDEMTCKACHSSTTATNNPAQIAAKPSTGWVNNADPEKDWKLNILRLHDLKKFADPVNRGLYVAALANKGFPAAGLEASANAGKPVLCASCHSSNALNASGYVGVRAFTAALHTKHATVNDPVTQTPLGSGTNIASCYMCHPGSQTECNRGAMSLPKDAQGNQVITCQDCHGSMAQVGNVARTGWLDVPNCQACHHDGQRLQVGVDANGKPLATTDTRFATNANTPLAGKSLYRFSKGHGGLQCEACHGATHAEYPSSHSQDNALSLDLQGHAGPVVECTACHTKVPTTTTGGPHGMHTTGQAWVSGHESAAKANRTACTACHGADYRGSPLSKVWVAKTFTVEGSTKTFPAGHQVNCYDCHNGPNP